MPCWRSLVLPSRDTQGKVVHGDHREGTAAMEHAANPEFPEDQEWWEYQDLMYVYARIFLKADPVACRNAMEGCNLNVLEKTVVL